MVVITKQNKYSKNVSMKNVGLIKKKTIKKKSMVMRGGSGNEPHHKYGNMGRRRKSRSNSTSISSSRRGSLSSSSGRSGRLSSTGSGSSYGKTVKSYLDSVERSKHYSTGRILSPDTTYSYPQVTQNPPIYSIPHKNRIINSQSPQISRYTEPESKNKTIYSYYTHFPQNKSQIYTELRKSDSYYENPGSLYENPSIGPTDLTSTYLPQMSKKDKERLNKLTVPIGKRKTKNKWNFPINQTSGQILYNSKVIEYAVPRVKNSPWVTRKLRNLRNKVRTWRGKDPIQRDVFGRRIKPVPLIIGEENHSVPLVPLVQNLLYNTSHKTVPPHYNTVDLPNQEKKPESQKMGPHAISGNESDQLQKFIEKEIPSSNQTNYRQVLINHQRENPLEYTNTRLNTTNLYVPTLFTTSGLKKGQTSRNLFASLTTLSPEQQKQKLESNLDAANKMRGPAKLSAQFLPSPKRVVPPPGEVSPLQKKVVPSQRKVSSSIFNSLTLSIQKARLNALAKRKAEEDERLKREKQEREAFMDALAVREEKKRQAKIIEREKML